MEQQGTVEFSIIVPIYKVEAYLHQCIDSILAQTYPNFELILVDDGSPDNCGKICDEYASKDARIKVIHQENKGVCIARKVGVQNVKGEYVCWVDADDYVANCFLEGIKKVIDDYEPDFIAFNFKRVDNDGSILYIGSNKIQDEKLYMTDDSEFYSNLIYDCNVKNTNFGTIMHGLCAKAIKKKIIIDAMLSVPDQVRYGEDMAAIMVALCQSRKVYISKLCDYFYRWNPTSITNSIKEDDFKRRCILYDFIGHNLPKIPQRNTDAYAFSHILPYVIDKALCYNNYDDYITFVNTILSKDVCEIIDRIKLPRLSLNYYVKSLLLKHRMFKEIWLILHIKSKVRNAIHFLIQRKR